MTDNKVTTTSQSAVNKSDVEEGQQWTRMSIETNEGDNSWSGIFNRNQLKRLGSFATYSSWLVNWCLLIVKLYALVTSGSKAVAASLADSAVDLVSQAVLMMAGRYISKPHPDYPIGRSRLEALSVLACASIMSMSSVEVIQFSCQDIVDGTEGEIPVLTVTIITYTLLCFAVVSKLLLFLYCRWVNTYLRSDSIEALAEDHLNDVMSNIAAGVAVAITMNTTAWWVDPAGAILISIVIIFRWASVMNEQVKKIVGHTAPPEYIEMINEMARAHDARLFVDCTRAYHFGAKYVNYCGCLSCSDNVEMEIVLPGTMTVMESHDIALALQHKIERLFDVERAFVHVDHHFRDGLEHKVERELYHVEQSNNNSNTNNSTSNTPRDVAVSSNSNSKNSTMTNTGKKTAVEASLEMSPIHK